MWLSSGRLHLAAGLLRPQPVHAPRGWRRVALVATSALLLGGDEVVLDVRVGAGERLELIEVAGTVAYNGRGRRSGWRVRVRLDDDAVLIVAGEPLVVSDGATVDRSMVLQADERSRALVRETVVFGRAGERGGTLRSRTEIIRAGRLAFLEEQLWDPATRALPGILGGHRVLDALLVVDGPVPPADLPSLRFVDGHASLTRFVGSDLSSSTLHAAWPSRVQAVRG